LQCKYEFKNKPIEVQMSNYNKTPFFKIKGEAISGWDSIINELQSTIKQQKKERFILVVECYHGVYHDELVQGFNTLSPEHFYHTEEVFFAEEEIRRITYPDVTDDAIFGYLTRLRYENLIDSDKLAGLRKKINSTKGLIIIYGHAAAVVAEHYDCIIYADMARWEIQLRQRKHEINNIGINNADETPGIQYKRSYFVDWRICDKLKQQLFTKADYWLDTNKANHPKMIVAETLLQGMEELVQSPFRTVPYFDPGPWGGQWMKDICGLDKSALNYAWAFDGVPEENSLLFKVGEEIIEIPSINLVFYKSKELLGEPVESRFGKEFPIRFDFLDTMGGGNLSLQVHPSTHYIQENFGMKYTQDESYYLLDAKDDATVFLGLKEGVDSREMIAELNKAQDTGGIFDAEKYVNVFPARKHDHFLIPNGTIHCSGTNSMVLEISSSVYIFTFKLYDWGRLGLDGEQRTINIKHGSNVIDWSRDTNYCKENLINTIEVVEVGDGWREERTGLHKNQFIETRRHWFTGTTYHSTNDSVNVLNLVEGDEAIVESPTHAFEPFIVHYAETFIVPAIVGDYTIRPYGKSNGKQCATIKAYVRHKA
jgi:mannose-6-phosphate isomerase class I